MLYQGYFIALLVLGTLKAPLNPGNPYVGSKTQNGLSTFGGPDFAATVGEVAARSLDKVWYQKWLVHLTHRPEFEPNGTGDSTATCAQPQFAPLNN